MEPVHRKWTGFEDNTMVCVGLSSNGLRGSVIDVTVTHPGPQHPPAAHEAHIQNPVREVRPAGLQIPTASLVEAGLGIEGHLVHQRAEAQAHVAQTAATTQSEQPLHERL